MPNHLTTGLRLAQVRGAHLRLRAAICALADRCQHVQVDQVALPLWEVRDEASRTAREARALPRKERGFTFIELLVVMILVAILASMAYPAFSSVMERARKTQAKNDLTQIVTAVNAYYTEYGKYPIVIDDTPITNNADLFYTLRAVDGGTANAGNAANPRKIVFISPPDAKDQTNSRSGIKTSDGQWYDPWGTPYRVAIDGTYDNQITPNPYTADTGAGPATLTIGVIAWSFGKNGILGGDLGGTIPAGFTSEGGTANQFSGSGDVISWQ
jgi:prepilin-type N-terminal cleavage/methylation domain-containing protein